MSEAKPECFGKMPPYQKRGVACGYCRVFDGCALETMRAYFAGKGVLMEPVKSC